MAEAGVVNEHVQSTEYLGCDLHGRPSGYSSHARDGQPADIVGGDPVVPRIHLLTTLARSAFVAAVQSLKNRIIPLRDAVLGHL